MHTDEFNRDTLHAEALLMDRDRDASMQWLAKQAAQTCEIHPERKATNHVYERRDGMHHKCPRCAECYEAALAGWADQKAYESVSRGKTYEEHGPLIMGADGKTYRQQRLK